ncbi:MAG TPA: hypothetical protein VJ752_14320 [Burkholderiaceae bacterium]|nr:hypothetical protein [Burkholderiaceae bacterium]
MKNKNNWPPDGCFDGAWAPPRATIRLIRVTPPGGQNSARRQGFVPTAQRRVRPNGGNMSWCKP